MPRAARKRGHGVRIVDLADDGAGARAGLKVADVIRSIGGRRIRNPKSALSALALVRSGASVDVIYEREGQRNKAKLLFQGPGESPKQARPPDKPVRVDFPYPQSVCRVRQAVFPVESFDPIASAVRIGNDLLVTNKHVVGARKNAKIFTPSGELTGKVLVSSYPGDLVLIQVEGLPKGGLVMKMADAAANASSSKRYYVVGAAVVRKEVRVFKPGALRFGPDKSAALGRLHVTAQMQPGVSGGALIDGDGKLIGIAVGGGEGRNEAIPLM